MTTPQIYSAAQNVSPEQYEAIFQTLNAFEKKLSQSLVSLGDSKELALFTAIGEKEKEDGINIFHYS